MIWAEAWRQITQPFFVHDLEVTTWGVDIRRGFNRCRWLLACKFSKLPFQNLHVLGGNNDVILALSVFLEFLDEKRLFYFFDLFLEILFPIANRQKIPVKGVLQKLQFFSLV